MTPTTPLGRTVTLALRCNTEQGPALLVTGLDRELAQHITNHITAAEISPQTVTYAEAAMDVSILEDIPQDDPPNAALIQPSGNLSTDIKANGLVIHPGGRLSFRDTYGAFDDCSTLEAEFWQVDQHGAVLTAVDRHTGETYTSTTVSPEVFTDAAHQLDPHAIMTVIMDTATQGEDVLTVSLNREHLKVLLRAAQTARQTDADLPPTDIGVQAHLTRSSLGISREFAQRGTDVLLQPGSTAAFSAAHPHPLHALTGTTWTIHDQEIRLSGVHPLTGERVTSTDLTAYLLCDALLTLAPDPVPTTALLTPDGDTIIGTVWAQLHQAPATFRRTGPADTHSRAVTTAGGDLTADLNLPAATLTPHPTWTPKDAQGRETPWIDTQGRLWAPEDLRPA